MATINPIAPIEIKRVYQHSCAKIFSAFSTAEALAQWIAPMAEIETEVLLHQFRVGGKYRIRFVLPDSEVLHLGGEYVQIEPPNDICFTWQWEAPDTHADINSLVSIKIRQIDAGSELTVVHENLSEVAAIERHTQGWRGALYRLEVFLNLDQE